MQVAADKVVYIHFSLSDAAGELIDRSADQEPWSISTVADI